MKLKYSAQLLPILIIIASNSATTWSMSSIKNYVPFLSKKEELATINKEYIVKPGLMVTIKNTNGDITLKTWNQDKITLTAVKRAATKELLDTIDMTDTITTQNLTITTVAKQPGTAIDYTLMIPAHVSVNITNQMGSTSITGQLKGTACLTTTVGNLHIEKAENTVICNVLKSGSTTIDLARSNVKSTSAKGPITVNNAYGSVLATAEYGNIDVKSVRVPATSKIKLATNVGLINLQLPSEVNADLQASTKRGAIVSQHMITLKPKTTTLDSKAWKQFKERVDGILGTGEATIVLNTNKGNIKILNDKIA